MASQFKKFDAGNSCQSHVIVEINRVWAWIKIGRIRQPVFILLPTFSLYTLCEPSVLKGFYNIEAYRADLEYGIHKIFLSA